MLIIFDSSSERLKFFNGCYQLRTYSSRSKSIDRNEWFSKTLMALIDDIRIYDRALSAEEISLLYRAESPNHFVDSAKDLEMIWVEPAPLPWGRLE